MIASLRLIEPSAEYAASYAEALREGLRIDPVDEKEITQVKNDFAAWLHDLTDLTTPIILPDGTKVLRVPSSFYWLIRDGKFIGSIALRHELNSSLLNYGGHIGYSVRASERRKGYATMMLSAVLQKAKTRGITRALITCRDDNTGSIRTIEKAGGVFENKVTLAFRDVPERRYWVHL